MKKYLYTTMNSKGQEQTGILEAESKNDVVTLLKSQGLFPISVKIVKAVEIDSGKDSPANDSQEFILKEEDENLIEKDLKNGFSLDPDGYNCKLIENGIKSSGIINMLLKGNQSFLIFHKLDYSGKNPEECLNISIDEIAKFYTKGFLFFKKLFVECEDGTTYAFSGNLDRIRLILKYELLQRGK